MNCKASASLAIAVLLALSCIPCCSIWENTDAADDLEAHGAFNNPKMLSSDYSNCRVICKGETMTAYIGLNWNSFFDPTLTVKSWICTDIDDFKGADHENSITLKATPTPYSSTSPVSASLSELPGTDNGIYALTLTVSDFSGSPPTASYYKFKVILAESVASRPYSQEFYYGIYLKVTDNEFSVSVKGTNGPLGTDSDNPLWLEQNAAYPVAVFGGAEPDSTNYCFYAEGLPDGFNMKIDGTISGKASGEILKSSQDGMATLYAISKLDATESYSGPLYYTLALDSFDYSIDVNGDQMISCFENSYVAIKNTGKIKVTVYDLGGPTGTYTAQLIHDGTPDPLTIPESLTITLDMGELGLSDSTGIIQLKITKAVENKEYVATVHMMLVGPAVHSGLSPAVTST